MTHRTPRILIVEDSEELLEIWLELFGVTTNYTLKGCTSGAAALAAIGDEFRPDVLVTDYFINDLTGLELMSRIEEKIGQVVSIMVTGNSDSVELRSLARRGEFVLMPKPVKFDRLRKCIEEIVAGLNLTLPYPYFDAKEALVVK